MATQLSKALFGPIQFTFQFILIHGTYFNSTSIPCPQRPKSKSYSYGKVATIQHNGIPQQKLPQQHRDA